MANALVPQMVLFLYFQAVEWIDLFPWNDLAGGNPQQPLDIALGGLQLALMAWTSRGSRVALRVAGVFYGLWLALQVASWWPPYFFGTGNGAGEAYLRFFGRTYKFLPPIADHPVPDANHVVLQLLLGWLVVALFAGR